MKSVHTVAHYIMQMGCLSRRLGPSRTACRKRRAREICVKVPRGPFRPRAMGNRLYHRRLPNVLRWSIDAGDAFSIAKVRRAVIEELETLAGKSADLFTLETVLGELLVAEMERGHVALAVIIEQGLGGPTVHVYTQGPVPGGSTRGELREAILSGTRLPMSVELTAQGRHYCLHLPMAHETPLTGDAWQVVQKNRKPAR